jgi:hypothetical protein
MGFQEIDTVAYRIVIFFLSLTFFIVGICNISNYNAILNDTNDEDIGLGRGTVYWFWFLNVAIVLICISLFVYNLWRVIFKPSVTLETVLPNFLFEKSTGLVKIAEKALSKTPEQLEEDKENEEIARILKAASVNKETISKKKTSQSGKPEIPEGVEEGEPIPTKGAAPKQLKGLQKKFKNRLIRENKYGPIPAETQLGEFCKDYDDTEESIMKCINTYNISSGEYKDYQSFVEDIANKVSVEKGISKDNVKTKIYELCGIDDDYKENCKVEVGDKMVDDTGIRSIIKGRLSVNKKYGDINNIDVRKYKNDITLAEQGTNEDAFTGFEEYDKFVDKVYKNFRDSDKAKGLTLDEGSVKNYIMGICNIDKYKNEADCVNAIDIKDIRELKYNVNINKDEFKKKFLNKIRENYVYDQDAFAAFDDTINKYIDECKKEKLTEAACLDDKIAKISGMDDDKKLTNITNSSAARIKNKYENKINKITNKEEYKGINDPALIDLIKTYYDDNIDNETNIKNLNDEGFTNFLKGIFNGNDNKKDLYKFLDTIGDTSIRNDFKTYRKAKAGTKAGCNDNDTDDTATIGQCFNAYNSDKRDEADKISRIKEILSELGKKSPSETKIRDLYNKNCVNIDDYETAAGAGDCNRISNTIEYDINSGRFDAFINKKINELKVDAKYKDTDSIKNNSFNINDFKIENNCSSQTVLDDIKNCIDGEINAKFGALKTAEAAKKAADAAAKAAADAAAAAKAKAPPKIDDIVNALKAKLKKVSQGAAPPCIDDAAEEAGIALGVYLKTINNTSVPPVAYIKDNAKTAVKDAITNKYPPPGAGTTDPAINCKKTVENWIESKLKNFP